MKTSNSNSAAARISQSEAVLEAIQAGFFEVFLHRSAIEAILSRKNLKSVRIGFTRHADGTRELRIRLISQEGRENSLETNYVIYDSDLVSAAANYVVEFSCNDIRQLASQPECTGLRFFPGRCISQGFKSLHTLIAVGVRSNGFDIAGETGYLRSHRIVTNELV